MTARSLDIIMALGAALALLLGGFAGFAEECDEIPSEVLRLHIPANSDSPRDQEIKLALRDCVLQEYGTQLSGARSPRRSRRYGARAASGDRKNLLRVPFAAGR